MKEKPKKSKTKSEQKSRPVHNQAPPVAEKLGAVRWLVPTLVVVLSSIAFFPSLRNQFVQWDDNDMFIRNLNYRGLGWTELRWMFSTFLMGHYQPLSWVTLGLDYLLWGMDPFGYHLTNLLLHVANTIVFYFIALRLLATAFADPEGSAGIDLRLAAGFAALVFSIHPLRVESVAWATERRDVLSGGFFLLTILCYLKAAQERPSEPSRAQVDGLGIGGLCIIAAVQSQRHDAAGGATHIGCISAAAADERLVEVVGQGNTSRLA